MARFPVPLALSLLSICATSAAASSAEAVRSSNNPNPNIVFILIDDLGWADLGCYGNTFNETPNIDRLAGQGMRFTDAYAACPVCSPTRASIMTGKYPATLNLTDFIPGHWRPFEKLVVPEFNQLLLPRERTIGEALRDAGYRTGYFGKWHLGPPGNDPDTQGFDVSLVTAGGHFAPNFRTRPKIDVPDGRYLADVLTDRAIDFIAEHRAEPFFLYLSHYAVHIPLQAKQELVRKYEQKSKPADGVNHPVYAAMLESVDESVGRILGALQSKGLADKPRPVRKAGATHDCAGSLAALGGGGYDRHQRCRAGCRQVKEPRVRLI